MFPIKSSRSLCIFLLLCFLFTSCGRASQEPVPEDSSQVMESSDTSENMQVVNPVMEVSSLDEMQSQLGFEVPVLDKEIVSYVVLNIDEEPAIGCIDYKDGTAFRIQKGSGDISGIHGGVLESSVDFGSVTVFYYTMEDLHYALWECDGFTYSLEGAESLEADVTSFLVVSEPEITEPEAAEGETIAPENPEGEVPGTDAPSEDEPYNPWEDADGESAETVPAEGEAEDPAAEGEETAEPEEPEETINRIWLLPLGEPESPILETNYTMNDFEAVGALLAAADDFENITVSYPGRFMEAKEDSAPYFNPDLNAGLEKFQQYRK
jgi:hypothetical protein